MDKGGRERGFVFSWAFAHAVVLWDALLSYKLSIPLWPCALSTSWSSEDLLGQWEMVTLQMGSPIRLSVG